METNDALKRTLMSVAERSIEQLVLSMQQMTEGDLQELEQQIVVQTTELGRKCLEEILEQQAKRQRSAARRKGACGHSQRFVKTRPRHLLTLLGPMTIHRAYYQCLRKPE